MKQPIPPGQLLKESQAIWEQVGRAELGAWGRLNLSGDAVELSTDDLLARLPLFAQLAGVDPDRMKVSTGSRTSAS